MGWRVQWQLFDIEEWHLNHPGRQLELDYWELVVESSRWESVADVLADQHLARQMGDWIWFLLPLAGIRVGTQLDFLHQRVWVRGIEPM